MTTEFDNDAADNGVDDDIATGEHKAVAPAAGEDTVADAGALFIGVSRRKDEYGRSITDRDAMSDEELASLGVEPDLGPTNTLVGTFVALTLAVGLAAVVLGAVVTGYAHRAVTEAGGNVDHVLQTQRDAARATLGAYAAVEHADEEPAGPTGYRVPVEVGMDLVVSRSDLLAGHPLGTHHAPIEPPTPVVEGSGEGSGEGAALVPADDPTLAVEAAAAPSGH